MGLETIQKEILEIVENIAKENVDEALKEAENIVNIANETAEKNKADESIKAENIIDNIKIISKASAKFEVKKLHLISKKDVIINIFKTTKNKIKALDAKTEKKLTLILLKDAQKQMDVKYVLCNEKASKWIKSDKNIKVKIIDILGGIVAENKDKKLRIDNSFETILEDIRKESLYKIAKGIY